MIAAIGPLRVCLIILWLGVFLPATANAQGKWVKLASFPEPAEELLGAAANGKMYVFCGLAPGWKPIGMVYEYDPATDKWAKKSPMPLLSHHVAFTEYRGKIYAFGGFLLPAAGPAAWAPALSSYRRQDRIPKRCPPAPKSPDPLPATQSRRTRRFSRGTR